MILDCLVVNAGSLSIYLGFTLEAHKKVNNLMHFKGFLLASKEMRGAGHSVSDDPSPCLLLPHSLEPDVPGEALIKLIINSSISVGFPLPIYP